MPSIETWEKLLTHFFGQTADGDQHPHPTKADEHTGPRLEEGKENSHAHNDPLDDRSLANRAKAEKAEEKREKEAEEAAAREKPTDAARRHGNEPSRGAKVSCVALRCVRTSESQLTGLTIVM